MLLLVANACGCHVPLTMPQVSFRCSQRHLAALCKSDGGPIPGAAGGHSVHHNGRLYSHHGQVSEPLPCRPKT